MRVVRELVMNQLRWQGEVLLHAAALEEGGGAILISAERGGGKTTLLTYLLRHLGARYIANDRVWLRAIAGAPVARGMPSVVTLRRPTLEMFPSLERGLESSGWSMRSRLDEEQAKPSALERRWKGGRYGITPAQYCRLVGASSIAEAPLRLAVFPSITGEPRRAQLVPLSASQVAARLEQGLFGAGSWRRISRVFDLDRGSMPLASQADAAARLASTVPCFECRLGLAAYESDVLAREIRSLVGS